MLAERFDAPMFEPHLTIYSGPYPNSSAVDSIVRTAVANISPIRLRAAGLGHSREFTRTLFVKFEQNEILTELSRAFRKSSADEHYRLEPHLSLVYARIPAERRDRLADDFRLPGDILFDRVRAMETGRTASKADVEHWRTAAENALHCA